MPVNKKNKTKSKIGIYKKLQAYQTLKMKYIISLKKDFKNNETNKQEQNISLNPKK